MSESALYERQPGETPKQYHAFCLYRDMPASERSLRRVTAQIHGDDYRDSQRRTIEKYSSRNNWVERVRAWDLERDRASRQAELEAIAEMRRKHIEESRALQHVAVQSLLRLREEIERDPNRKLTPGMILRYITAGAQMERLTRGEPTEITHGEHAVTAMSWNEYLRSLREERGLDASELPATDQDEAD